MSINQFVCGGRLGRDPVRRVTASGTEVCNFSVATESGWGDGAKTQWVKVIAFGKLASLVAEYTHKGDYVVVVGEIQNRKWEKDGIERTTTELIANKVDFSMNPKSKNDQPSSYQQTTAADYGEEDIPF